ncbi:hypothetical protein [Mycobacterium sp. TY813]|uniref:hypothetical protein n=1 Tax=Mycobacterium TaxID=1763 RepID=UPI002741F9C0|nr:hypothetical protein [Mycobacterium sp. TY813]MDP7731499.1 hypothetical protein [Mycobacterium sp. TY813]
MTTITPTPDPALPPGADPENVDGWDCEAPSTRLVWSTPMPLPDHLECYDIRLVASQRRDGTIVSSDADGPLVYIGGEDYTPNDARLVADALVKAANLADKWGGATPTEDRLSAAKDAVMAAYLELRAEPGNAGDYLRAALDCIADAQAVTR